MADVQEIMIRSSLDPKVLKDLINLKGIPPSVMALAIINADREVGRAALLLSLSEQDAASIIAGQPVLGTYGNEERGIESGSPMDEENLINYNIVRESCFYLAAWKKSVEDFYAWQRTREENWRAVYELQEIMEGLPLSVPDNVLVELKKQLGITIKAAGLTEFIGDDLLLEENELFEVTIFRSKLERKVSDIIGEILEDQFDFNGSVVDENYIYENCPILGRVLAFAVRTFIVRNRSLQEIAIKSEELSNVVKPQHMEKEIRSPSELDSV